jgi:hypothetical protein
VELDDNENALIFKSELDNNGVTPMKNSNAEGSRDSLLKQDEVGDEK